MTDTTDTPDSPGRFQVRATADSHFGWLRTRFGVENTMMAGQRTAISLIGFGFAIVQFFDRLEQMPGALPAQHPWAPQYLGMSLILCGVLTLVYSIWWYWRIVGYLWSDSYTPLAGVREGGMRSPQIVIAILLIGIGLFAFFAVLFRLV